MKLRFSFSFSFVLMVLALVLISIPFMAPASVIPAWLGTASQVVGILLALILIVLTNAGVFK